MVTSTMGVREVADSPYAARAVLDRTALESIGEANTLFLHLVADRGAPAAGDVLGLAAATAARIRGLDVAGRRAVAQCPYTLFDLRFRDAAFWRHVARDSGTRTRIAEDGACFARTATYLAWHLAHSKDLAAALVFGMTPEVQCAWRAIPLSGIERVAMAALPYLEARWGRHATFWPQLIDSAVPAARERAETVRLLGLQLLAADGLPPRVARAAGPLPGA